MPVKFHQISYLISRGNHPVRDRTSFCSEHSLLIRATMIQQVAFLCFIGSSQSYWQQGGHQHYVTYQKITVFRNQLSPIVNVSAAKSFIECAVTCHIKYGDTFCCYSHTFDEKAQSCACHQLVSSFQPNTAVANSNNPLITASSVCGRCFAVCVYDMH